MSLSDRQLKEVLEHSLEKLTEMASALNVNLKQSPFARQVRAWTDGFKTGDKVAEKAAADKSDIASSAMGRMLLGDPLPFEGAEDEAAAQARPAHASSVLAAGIQDISNSLVEDFALNDILRIILETMYSAMGFKHVLLCLKDAHSPQMVGRLGFGPDTRRDDQEIPHSDFRGPRCLPTRHFARSGYLHLGCR